MSTPYSPRAEYARVVRLINAKFAALPKETQDSIDLGDDWLDLEVERALKSDDQLRARNAIESYRQHWVAVLDKAAAR